MIYKDLIKKVLRESFRNITSDGYRLAETDVSPEIAKTANDPLGKQTFSIQCLEL